MKAINNLKSVLFIVSFFLLTLTFQVNAQQNRGRQQEKQQTKSNRGSENNGHGVGTIARSQVTYKKRATKVTAVRNLPTSSKRVTYNNTTYQVSNGRYYTNNGGKYLPVVPSIGLRIDALPIGFINVLFGNHPYYYYDGIFYSGSNNNYEVIAPQERMPGSYLGHD